MDCCIKDSGERTEFATGAVRDIQKGKGRCDLMPLDVLAQQMNPDGDPNIVIKCIHRFTIEGRPIFLYYAVDFFCDEYGWSIPTMALEVSKHFEQGAEKYGENNWQKGLPAKCYINSAVRHYLKWQRGDKDENHHLAFCWNLLCCIWTCENKPELNDYSVKPCPVCGEPLPTEAKFCDNCRVSIGNSTLVPSDLELESIGDC